MMKDSSVFYDMNCNECCIVPHSTRRHGEISSKRFKSQVDEYLSQDDLLWENAINVQHKLEQLQINIKKLREQTIQNIYAKKLSYALAWDKADDIQNSFKTARDGEWKKLTCANAFRVQQKINKGRKVDEKDVKTLTQTIISDTQKSVEILVKNCFANLNLNEGRYEKQEREERRLYRNRQDQIPRRQQRRPRRQQSPQRQERVPRMEPPRPSKPTFNNEYPLVKINQISQIDTHFNVIVKVQKIHKQFFLNQAKKTEFLGGDETGIATLVIDSQRLIRVGAVISISSARIYSFHGMKQIQQSNKSQIKQEKNIIINDVNEEFNLSKKRRNHANDKGERRDRPRGEDKDRRPYRVDRSRMGNTENEEEEEKPLIREERRQENPRRYQKMDEKVQEDRPSRASRYDQRSEVSKQSSKVAEKDVRNANKNRYSSSSSSDQDEKTVEQQVKIEKDNSSAQKEAKGDYTKIKDVEPGDENLTIIAEIFELQTQGPPPLKGHFLSAIGDETGYVRMILPKSNPAVKEGAVLRLVNANVEVDPKDHRITLVLSEDGYCEKTNIKIPKINIQNNMSQLQWESDQEEDDDEEEEEKKEIIIEDF